MGLSRALQPVRSGPARGGLLRRKRPGRVDPAARPDPPRVGRPAIRPLPADTSARRHDGMVRDHFLAEIVDREEVGEGVDNVEEGVGMAVVHTGLPLFSVLQAFF